jgi:CarD family transcriptional regulator
MMNNKEALELIERMPFVTTIKAPNTKVRIELFKASINSGEPMEWIKVIKTHYVRTHTGAGDELTADPAETRLAAIAKNLLEAELAKSLVIPRNEVETYINTYLDENF